jgi:hypothetical protein
MRADLLDGVPDSFPLIRIKNNGFRSQSPVTKATPAIAAWEVRCLESIVKPIDRPTFIAVEPRAIGTEGDEITKREIGIVSHRAPFDPSAYADGTDFIALPY